MRKIIVHNHLSAQDADTVDPDLTEYANNAYRKTNLKVVLTSDGNYVMIGTGGKRFPLGKTYQRAKNELSRSAGFGPGHNTPER